MKHLLPMLSSPSGRSTLCRAAHPKNASSPMVLSAPESENSTCARLVQLRKAETPMDSTEAPTETQEGQGPEPAPLTRRQLRAKARLEKAAQKEEQKEAARQKQQLLREEKARAMDRKRGEKRQRRQEKRERRAQIRAERREEIRSLTGFAGFAMLVVFALLAVDQAGLYGFLFVWLFLGVAAASVALLLLGILRAVRRKRCGIVFLLSLIGIAASIVWGAFLSAPWGLGLGPVFFIR